MNKAVFNVTAWIPVLWQYGAVSYQSYSLCSPRKCQWSPLREKGEVLKQPMAYLGLV